MNYIEFQPSHVKSLSGLLTNISKQGVDYIQIEDLIKDGTSREVFNQMII